MAAYKRNPQLVSPDLDVPAVEGEQWGPISAPLDGRYGNGARAASLPREDMSALAGQGVTGAGTRFPYADQLERLFGGRDFDALSAHYDDRAKGACQTLGAEAFTQGTDVAFQGRPSLWVSAHEAAHALLQSDGQRAPGGMGKEGDQGERHANEIADRVVAGRSAVDLLPEGADFAPTHPPHSVQCYKEETTPDGSVVRVSDDGHMAVNQNVGPDQNGDGVPAYQYGTHDFWSDLDLGAWNDTLTDKDSVISLSNGTQPSPLATNPSLKEVDASNSSNSTSGDSMKIWADCGMSGRDVMGAGQGQGGHAGGPMTAVYYKERDASFMEKLGDWWNDGDWNWDLKIREENETKASDPEEMKEEILSNTLELPPDQALAAYENMSPEERLAYDQKTGINQYAQPGVGEGYTMASHGEALPVTNEDEALLDKTGDGYIDMWNFHWAGVVGTSGADKVTLENYATGDATEQNSNWEHQMYGSTPGQTFHDQHAATGQHGSMPFTFQVRQNEP